jgi:hypothetical protein
MTISDSYREKRYQEERMSHRILLALFLAGTLVACPDPQPPPVVDFTLALQTDEINVTQGSSATVNLSFTRTGSAPIALTLEDTPDGVIGSFTPALVTGASSVLTVNVGAATPNVYTLKVKASSGAVKKSASVKLTVSAATQPTFALLPRTTSLKLAQNVSGSVTIDVDRIQGFSGSVNFNLENPPLGLNAAFDPASTLGVTTNLILTTSSIAAGTYNLTLRGVSGATVKTANLSLEVTSSTPTPLKTVTGRVIGSSGAPVAKARVAIPGHAFVTTDAIGAFSVQGVAFPYSVYIAADDGTGSFQPNRTDVIVYDQLSLEQPTLVSDTFGTTAPFVDRTLRINLPAAACASGKTILVRVDYDEPGFQEDAVGNCVSGQSFFERGLDVPNTGNPITAKLFVLVRTNGSGGAPDSFQHFTNPQFSLTPGTAPVVVDATTLETTPMQTVRLRAFDNGAPTTAELQLELVTGSFDTDSLLGFGDSTPVLEKTFSVPRIPGATLYAEIVSEDDLRIAFRSNLPTTTANIDLSLPAPLTVGAPSNGSTGVKLFEQTFEVNATPGGVQAGLFGPNDAAGQTQLGFDTLRVVTNAPSFRLPDVRTALALNATPAPSTVNMFWYGHQLNGFANVEDFVRRTDGTGQSAGDLLGNLKDGSVVYSDNSDFVTTPNP